MDNGNSFFAILPFLIIVFLHILYYKKIIPLLHSLIKILNIVVGFLLSFTPFILVANYGHELPIGLIIFIIILNFIIATPFYFLARLYGRVDELEKNIK